MYECRFDSDQTTIKLDPINLLVYGEDDDETDETPGMTKPLLPTEADGMTRVIGNHHYRQTRSGAWRMVAAFGSFFVKSSNRPDYILSHMWRDIQRRSKATQGLALQRFNASDPALREAPTVGGKT